MNILYLIDWGFIASLLRPDFPLFPTQYVSIHCHHPRHFFLELHISPPPPPYPSSYFEETHMTTTSTAFL